MKKNMIRVLALVLVLILALGLIPLGAMAVTVTVNRDYFNQATPSTKYPAIGSEYVGEVGGPTATSVTIKTSDYDGYLVYGGKGYDLQGILNPSKPPALGTGAYPLVSSYTFKSDSPAWLFYTPHNHRLTGWAIDPTNHWRNCTVCKEEFIGINWHFDNDLDDFCDVCGSEIYYYDITEKDCEGGKVTVKEDSARYRDMIYADVEAEEGYELYKVHFYKVRPNGTRSELTRYTQKRGQTYYFKMPSFEVEVEAEFFKK